MERERCGVSESGTRREILLLIYIVASADDVWRVAGMLSLLAPRNTRDEG